MWVITKCALGPWEEGEEVDQDLSASCVCTLRLNLHNWLICQQIHDLLSLSQGAEYTQGMSGGLLTCDATNQYELSFHYYCIINCMIIIIILVFFITITIQLYNLKITFKFFFASNWLIVTWGFPQIEISSHGKSSEFLVPMMLDLSLSTCIPYSLDL